MKRDIMIGREKEWRRLSLCVEAEQPQFVVIYGRRRVGKTYLINQFFRGRFDFKLTGIYNQPREYQLRNFIYELNRQAGTSYDTPSDWLEAFQLLRNYLSDLPSEEKCVVFLDEMPWMDTPKSDFLSAFEWFWNGWGNTRRNLILIVCGSSSSWISEKISKNKGGLFNRLTCRLYLSPFTLYETEQYLQANGISWSQYDIAECYMIMGGIPYYLSLLDPGLSYVRNIDNLFFRKRSELWDEFDHLYRTLFTNSEQIISIVETLSGRRSGMTRSELVQKTGISDSGHLSKMLKNLEDSGFVRVVPFFGMKKQQSRYQLADYYTMFYFRFLKGKKKSDENYWSNALDLPSRRSWAGLTFEQLCMDHIPQIKRRLGISSVLSEQSIWNSRQSGESSDAEDLWDRNGAQIDLIIDRRDRVINLCEIKFSVNQLEIDQDYDMKLRNKIEAFRRATSTTKALQLTLITTYGLKTGKYTSLVGSQVYLSDLFSEV